jgi:hypothetical protein
MFERAGLVPLMIAGGWQGEVVTADSPFYVVLASKGEPGD